MSQMAYDQTEDTAKAQTDDRTGRWLLSANWRNGRIESRSGIENREKPIMTDEDPDSKMVRVLSQF